jgi:hypothetical protein
MTACADQKLTEIQKYWEMSSGSGTLLQLTSITLIKQTKGQTREIWGEVLYRTFTKIRPDYAARHFMEHFM